MRFSATPCKIKRQKYVKKWFLITKQTKNTQGQGNELTAGTFCSFAFEYIMLI